MIVSGGDLRRGTDWRAPWLSRVRSWCAVVLFGRRLAWLIVPLCAAVVFVHIFLCESQLRQGRLVLAHEHLEHVDPTEQGQYGSIRAGGVRLLVRDSWWVASVLNTSGFPRGWGLRVIRGSVGGLVLCPRHTTSVVDLSSEDSECWELNLFEWASA